jgi:hypothetical protein
LLVVALGLGAYIYFVEMKREPAGVATTSKEKVFTTESSKYEELEIRAASGDVTTLKKVNGLWEIVKPEPVPTDSSEVGSLLSTLDTLEIQRVIDSPSSPADYGLEPARFSVAFKPAGETAMRRLEVGKKTPTGGDLYARVEGQPRVFLISAYLEDSLNKTTFGLRDKTALKFERDGVESLTIEVPGSPALAFAKKGSDWRFTKPYEAKADFAGVDGIVGRLSTARMSAIEAADGTSDLKKYGLDKPQAMVTIGVGSTQARLALGAKKDDTNLYARDLSRPIVFTVEPSLLEELKKKPDDLRKKDVFEFRSYSALSIDLTIGGQTFTFEKQKPAASSDPNAPPPADVWKQTKPAGKDLDQGKVTDFLTTMSNLRAESFADKAFASGTELVLTARFGDEKAPTSETVRFVKSGTAVHAILPGETSGMVVSTSDFDRALGLAKELTGAK